MGRFSDSPFFLLRSFFDGLDNTTGLEKPTNDFEWGVHFVSSFDQGDGTRTFSGDEPYTFDNTSDPNNRNNIWTDYITNTWNRREYYDGNIVQTFNSYIVAPFINITTRGGGLMDLFVKEKDEGYQPITVRYQSRVDNTFHFVNSGVKEYDPSEDPDPIEVLGGLSDSEDEPDYRYEFKFWDKIVRDTFNLFENDRETYFRKDSLYHEFLKVYAKDMMIDELGVDLDIRHYVNTDKLFSFFHRIFKSHDQEKCRIIFDGMKDYVMRAVPEHQRTENFTELCNVFFDQLYQEIFDMLKNVWTLIDPMEADARYLGYLSRYYDMFDVDVEGATILHVREFVRDMIWMIKRKGTYTEFYILWRILTATKNLLSVYERWHRRDVEMFPEWPSSISPACTGTWPNFPYYSDTNGTTTVPTSAWEDVLYVYRPEYESPVISGGAGPGWYQKWYPNVYGMDDYPPGRPTCVMSPSGQIGYTPGPSAYDNLMLSTHYILETDISAEPLAPNEILTKDIWDSMYRYWEYVRPVNRVSNYRIVEAPITDISGKYVHLYEVTSKSSAFLQTKSNLTYGLVDGGYVHPQQTPSTQWSVQHNLGKSVLVQVFDSDLNEVVPKDIEYTDSTAQITFHVPEGGFALVKRADWTGTGQPQTNQNTWRFYHLRLQKEVIVHFRQGDFRDYIDNTSLWDGQDDLIGRESVEGTFADQQIYNAMLGTGNVIIYQDTPSTVWEMPHGIGFKGNIMSVYVDDPSDGDDDIRIHPKEYELIDSNNCRIEFDNPVSGYIVLVSVGDLSIEDFLDELEDLLENPSWIAYQHDNAGNRIEIARNNAGIEVYKDDNFYYFDLKLEKEDTYTINEIDLFGTSENGYYDQNAVIFHSLMSNLYKPPGVDMTFHFRLEIPTSG